MSGYIRLAYLRSQLYVLGARFRARAKTRSLEKEMLIAVTGMNRVPN